MAECNTEDTPQSQFPETGKVRQVSQKWRVYEDGVMANQMQNEEFDYKYGLNRFNRKTSRADVPVAKFVQTAEEERLQKEKMLQLEEMNAIAARDAEMAKKVQQEELSKRGGDEEDRKRSAARDAEMAKKVQQEELSKRGGDEEDRKRRAMEDAAVASQFQTEELLRQQTEKLQLEMTDEEYAKYLQEKERRRYERKLKERELNRQRKTLQKEQEQTAGQLLTGYKMEAPVTAPPEGGFPINLQAGRMNGKDKAGVLRPDGTVEDIGDFSDFYIQPSRDMDGKEVQELQELQDEELARLLQDQEHKRGSQIDRQKLQEIEHRDAEIARLLYQQEKLKAKKHHQKHHQKRQDRPSSRDAGSSPMEPTSENHHNEHRAQLQQQQSMEHPPQQRPGPGGGYPPQHPHPEDPNSRQQYPGQQHPGQQHPGQQQQQRPPHNVAHSMSSEDADFPPHMRQSHQIPEPEHRPQQQQQQQQPSRNGRGEDPGQQPKRLGPLEIVYNPTATTGDYAGTENPYSTRPLPSPPTSQGNRGDVTVGGNIFSAVDPTFSGPSPPPKLATPPAGPPSQDPHYANTQNRAGADEYQDLDELRAPENFAPVAGHKRGSKSGKSGKDKNCKQQ